MNSDCRTCVYNTYIDIKPAIDWFDCCHPVARAKRQKPETGDPAIVGYWTSDVPVSRIGDIRECPTYEVRQ